MEHSDGWRAFNRANWDERVGIHLASPSDYDLTPLREGRARLHPIEEAELGSVDGLRILHLQCHFGRDTLTLAQQGAEVVGLDFSGKAIAAARELATELGLTQSARFVEADLYDAQAAIAEPGAFDRVFVTWGAIYWLPDIYEWARIAASFLKPGGILYLAEGHPCAWVFEDSSQLPNGLPSFAVPYFLRGPLVQDVASDYADDAAVLTNVRTYAWAHQLGEIVTAIIDAGLTLAWLREHDAIPWKMYQILTPADGHMHRWPAERWLPLAFSLQAVRPR